MLEQRDLQRQRPLGPEITDDMLNPEGDLVAAQLTYERLVKKGMDPEAARKVVGLA